MKKLRIAVCALSLALLAPLLASAWRALPIDTRPYVAQKYAGWSGVLRLWVFAGGLDGLSPWLNRGVSRFEKRHPGVYVQPQFVDAGAIETLGDSGLLPPDLLLVPPGLLETPAGLATMPVPDGVRAALRDRGEWGGESYAVPVALGGYLWAWNPAMIAALPDSWREAGVAPAVPEPEEWRRWDAALLALCAGSPAEPEDAPGAADAPGLDLGLAGGAPTATATPRPAAGTQLPCPLPDGFAFDGDAWRRFANGEAAALPVTQREVRRLEALADRGRGPDWRLDRRGAAFTDQLLFLAATAKPDGDPRLALCRELAEALLSDECQGELCRATAFSVTDAVSGYAANDSLNRMEAALRDPALAVPRCFGRAWREAAEGIVREFVENKGDSPELWRRLTEALR